MDDEKINNDGLKKGEDLRNAEELFHSMLERFDDEEKKQEERFDLERIEEAEKRSQTAKKRVEQNVEKSSSFMENLILIVFYGSLIIGVFSTNGTLRTICLVIFFAGVVIGGIRFLLTGDGTGGDSDRFPDHG